MSSAAALSPLPPLDASAALEPGIFIASLGQLEPPLEIDRFGGAPHGTTPARPTGELTFRFCYHEVPFQGQTSRRAGWPVLTLSGDLGILPFTIESARRRRRLRKILRAARAKSSVDWQVTSTHRIKVAGTIDLGVDLGMPLTPTALITGATTLLLACRPYLDLLVAVAGEA